MLSLLRLHYLLKDYLLLVRWVATGRSATLPPPLKRRFLARIAHAPSDWIETGTYRGLTTRFLAQRFPAAHIVTIEPAKLLYEAAKNALADLPNITVLHGDSAKLLGHAIAQVGDSVTFFLDGHYSGGKTYQNEHACPIPAELAFIAEAAQKMTRVTIFIDDARLLHQHEHTGYPSPQALAEWADRYGYSLHETQDIFILKRG